MTVFRKLSIASHDRRIVVGLGLGKDLTMAREKTPINPNEREFRNVMYYTIINKKQKEILGRLQFINDVVSYNTADEGSSRAMQTSGTEI